MHAATAPVPWPLRDFRGGWPGIDADQGGSTGWGPSVLSTAMLDELRRLDPAGRGAELTEVLAACVRLCEPARLSIALDDWVWPLTLFPAEGLYRAPIDWSMAPPPGLGRARLLECEPAADESPAHGAGRRPALAPCHYRLDDLLWTIALQGPLTALLRDIDFPTRFRVAASASGPVPIPGALGSAVARLQREAATLDEVSGWPGLGRVRACRLLNALQLGARLIVEGGRPN